ncbi:hypothetical protein [Celeribacter litoreus]|uniref:hypothetical protein n=1 Tax=Celeribacter litoreus TaxID=2876714 RepID=UPI001CCA017D|nr:hypothetical protein [Celeribacter litoreus]MCA0044018.1 hypothetical protein [Celeribacter litoreus]
MAYAGSEQLEKRLDRIEAQRDAIKRGTVYSVDHDGTIVARARRRSFRRPLHILVMAIAGLMLFKVVVFAALGPGTYNARVAELQEGSSVERVGAWVMEAGDITVFIATEWLSFMH